jgi:hypothetical protein
MQFFASYLLAYQLNREEYKNHESSYSGIGWFNRVFVRRSCISIALCTKRTKASPGSIIYSTSNVSNPNDACDVEDEQLTRFFLKKSPILGLFSL